MHGLSPGPSWRLMTEDGKKKKSGGLSRRNEFHTHYTLVRLPARGESSQSFNKAATTCPRLRAGRLYIDSCMGGRCWL